MSIDVEWRAVVDFPKYEINKYGRVRNAKTKRLIVTSEGSQDRLRVWSDGFRLSIPTSFIRNEAFPELKPY